MNKALLVSALASHAAHAIKNCISPREEPEMTTLSKEDVVRWADECVFDIMQADEYHAENEVIDSGNRWITDKMMAFATLSRADIVEANKALVAENERLKETQEMILFLQAGTNDEAVIKAAICSTEQAEERINLSVRACLNISTDQLRIAADARLDGLFKFKKRYEDQLTATRAALAAVEAREKLQIDALLTCQKKQIINECAPSVNYKTFDSDLVEKALAQPRDDSALREMIAEVYEECEEALRDRYSEFLEPEILGAIREIRALAEKAKAE